jgi:hypothetical protein
MIIGVDIDDTLSVLQKLKQKTAKAYIKQNKLPFKMINPNEQFFSKMFNWSAEECNKFWTECSEDLLAKSPPRKHVQKYINKLRQDRHKIVLITARSTQHLKDPVTLSVNWLNKNKINYDELCVNNLEKTTACLEKKIDVFIDDRVDHLMPLLEHNIKTILMQTVSNKDQTEYTGDVVKNWKQVYKIISNLNKNK